MGLMRDHWFTLGLILAILMAKMAPDLGPKLRPEITVKIFGVSLIFFLSGFTLKSGEFRESLKNVKLHFFVQIFAFVGFPLLVRILKVSIK